MRAARAAVPVPELHVCSMANYFECCAVESSYSSTVHMVDNIRNSPLLRCPTQGCCPRPVALATAKLSKSARCHPLTTAARPGGVVPDAFTWATCDPFTLAVTKGAPSPSPPWELSGSFRVRQAPRGDTALGSGPEPIHLPRSWRSHHATPGRSCSSSHRMRRCEPPR